MGLPNDDVYKSSATKDERRATKGPKWLHKLVVAGLLIFAASRLLSLPCWSRHGSERKVGTVKWSPSSECNPGTICGSVFVPKDYFNPEAGTASVAISVYKATKLPKKGTVFLNPGGPGGSGTRLAAPEFANLIGDDWDLLGFDPRGINKTEPQVQCFDTFSDFSMFNANTVLEQGFTVASSRNLSDPEIEKQLVEQARQFLVLKKSQAQLCAKNMGDDLRYMGTANVVRDMDFMAQIFDGKDAKINYWGASYGSILGAYLVNMLPHRVGFVTIDGIADPVNWSTEPSHKWPINWLASTEKTYRFYLETCSRAGPEACPLAQYTDEPYEAIESRLETFFDSLVVTPLPVPFGSRPAYLTSGAARALLLILLQRPIRWSESAHAFAQAMNSANGTLIFDALPRPSKSSYDLVRLGVTCMDSPPPSSPKEVPTPEDLAAELMKTMREVSPHFGASVSVGEPDGGCQYWPVKGPERFAGPWNASLEWPMLIVSNTMDPITPIQSGLRINSLMPDSSRLIIQDGPGHCSPATPTLCTINLVRNYFAGILPENGTMCGTEFDYFPDSSAKLEMEMGQSGDEVQTLSAEDRKMLESARVVGEMLQDIRQGS
ncbi:hypothetical protein R3P38DRAFT_1733804 [Favolaschia claudopus]|uniref:Alpha/beta-hydrolase n=1 Tax=Favolaschia claudopus TaxID=2862362 RepID=A0AAW0A9S8_9AGAR